MPQDHRRFRDPVLFAALCLAGAATALPILPPEPPPPRPDLIPVQSCTDCGGQQSGPAGGGGGGGTGGITPQRTGKIVIALGTANRTCSPEFVDRAYLVHCLRWELRRIVQGLPDTGDYAPVRAALNQASRELEAIAVKYADPSAPPIQPNVGGKPLAAQLPPLIGVRPADEDRALREAERVIEEAQTMLLRSAAGSQRRMVAYQEVAAALDSTKVLLRSA